jgi:hypothetical protein
MDINWTGQRAATAVLLWFRKAHPIMHHQMIGSTSISDDEVYAQSCHGYKKLLKQVKTWWENNRRRNPLHRRRRDVDVSNADLQQWKDQHEFCNRSSHQCTDTNVWLFCLPTVQHVLREDIVTQLAFTCAQLQHNLLSFMQLPAHSRCLVLDGTWGLSSSGWVYIPIGFNVVNPDLCVNTFRPLVYSLCTSEQEMNCVPALKGLQQLVNEVSATMTSSVCTSYSTACQVVFFCNQHLIAKPYSPRLSVSCPNIIQPYSTVPQPYPNFIPITSNLMIQPYPID